MANELIVNASLPETRIALMEDGEIQELLIERASEKGIVGNIYKGRVIRVLPGMQAAFVDIGLEKAAFLYVDDVYVHSESVWTEEDIEERFDSHSSDASDSEAEVEPEQEHEESSESVLSEEEDRSVESESIEEMSSDPKDQDPDGTLPAVISPPPHHSVNSSPQQRQPYRRGGSRRANGASRFRRGRKSPTVISSELQLEAINEYPEAYRDKMNEEGSLESDRSALSAEGGQQAPTKQQEVVAESSVSVFRRAELKGPRSRDRRIRQKPLKQNQQQRNQVNIQDLLKEGQEIIVQVAKDPISTKGARITCHISLAGRHLVCMPTINHVGISRRIERDDERRRLRDFVEKNRPKNLGFIVRTASNRQQSEKRIKQDIEYLSRLWTEIKEKVVSLSAPALIYEDLNSVLKAIRDWVTEEVDKVIVDCKDYYTEVQKFVSHFMPAIKEKIELYHGDIPIFDAYGISPELSRALERKVWLKSGGYIVIDQAEALVAIDVNTGRYVGKKNLEDTILKTNLEAVREIAYQLRLRNCGGIIILDFIDMEKEENRHRIYRALEEALLRDRARPTILKISELGLVEMTRKRTRDTLTRTLCESCSHCEGRGFIKGKMTIAYDVMREIEREGFSRDILKILVQAHPDVIDVLAIEERETLDQLEKQYNKWIYLQSVPNYHLEQFEVSVDKQQASQQQNRLQHRKQPAPHQQQRDSSVRSSQPSVPESAPRVVVSEHVHDEARAQVKTKESSAVSSPLDAVDEEDRLAFLRAQAAQDAALARLGGGNTNATGNGSATHTNNGGGGRRYNNRPSGRRGGSNNKYRRNNRFRYNRTGGQQPYGHHANGNRNESDQQTEKEVASDVTTGNDSDGDSF